jgi:hypothetical protein
MKHKYICALVLGVGLCFGTIAKAQDQSDGRAVTNPPRYGAAAQADTPYPQAAPVANQLVPPELVLPAGTLIMVRLTDPLSSDRNKTGDGFTAVLDQPLVAQGWVVARRGQTVVGQVAAAQKAGRVQGVSQLAVELTEIVAVDGGQMPVRTALVQSSAGTSRERDAAGIGATTGIGAAIGAAAGRGEGAAIGAAVGAVAGIAGVLSTRGRATELYPETLLAFRLQDPVTITTQQAQQAFKPVDQADYGSTNGQRNRPRTFRAVESYPPPYYYPPYYYPYYSDYGYYGYYGYGPRIVVGPRRSLGGRGSYGHRR